MTNPETTKPEIRFYHLERQSVAQALPGLVARAYESGKRICVRTADEAEAERLNESLWTYDPDSFVPHGSKKDGEAARQPVWLSPGNDNPNSAEILIVTGDGEDVAVDGFTLCCFLFDGRDEDALAVARMRWKRFKAEGLSLTYWQQGAKGWEKKEN